MWMDNVEISKSRFQRAGEGLHLAKPGPECSWPARRLGTADQPAGPDRGALFVPASGANAGGAPRSARSLTATPTPPFDRGAPQGSPVPLAGREEGGDWTRSGPCGRARIRAARRAGEPETAAPARWPSKDPPGPMAGGATCPDWCRRSADHCGNPGGGERGRMRSWGRGESEGRAEEVSGL